MRRAFASPRRRIWLRWKPETGQKRSPHVQTTMRWMFRKPARTRVAATAADLELMQRCIALSQQAVREGEWPFAAIICRGDEILAETVDRAASENDLARHAEMVVMSDVQRRLGRSVLRHCTLYTNVEPCV